MTISWYGQSCFRVETREATLAIDPFSKELGLVPPRFQADVVLVTHAHPDHANTMAFTAREGDAAPAIIAGPGEYEIRGLAISGILTYHDRSQGSERGLNTVYRIHAPSEDITLVHLGDLGETALRSETLEALGNVDILMIPVGGTYTIDGETASRIVNQIEPSLVIPMHYQLPGLKVKLAPLEPFLKSCGATAAERLERLSIKKRDLSTEETRVVVFTPGGHAKQ